MGAATTISDDFEFGWDFRLTVVDPDDPWGKSLTYERFVEHCSFDAENMPSVDWTKPEDYFIWVAFVSPNGKTACCAVVYDIVAPDFAHLAKYFQPDWLCTYWVRERENFPIMPRDGEVFIRGDMDAFGDTFIIPA